MSYRHHSFPYLLYAWKKKSQVDMFRLVTIANGSVLQWEPQKVVLKSSYQEGFKGRKRQCGHLLRCHSHIYPYARHWRKTLLIPGVLFLLTTSGTPVRHHSPHVSPDSGGLALLVDEHCVRILRFLPGPCSASAADTGFVSMESSWPGYDGGSWWSPGNFRLLFLSGFL